MDHFLINTQPQSANCVFPALELEINLTLIQHFVSFNDYHTVHPFLSHVYQVMSNLAIEPNPSDCMELQFKKLSLQQHCWGKKLII